MPGLDLLGNDKLLAVSNGSCCSDTGTIVRFINKFAINAVNISSFSVFGRCINVAPKLAVQRSCQ